jgi:hypothetical protein
MTEGFLLSELSSHYSHLDVAAILLMGMVWINEILIVWPTTPTPLVRLFNCDRLVWLFNIAGVILLYHFYNIGAVTLYTLQIHRNHTDVIFSFAQHPGLYTVIYTFTFMGFIIMVKEITKEWRLTKSIQKWFSSL